MSLPNTPTDTLDVPDAAQGADALQRLAETLGRVFGTLRGHVVFGRWDGTRASLDDGGGLTASELGPAFETTVAAAMGAVKVMILNDIPGSRSAIVGPFDPAGARFFVGLFGVSVAAPELDAWMAVLDGLLAETIRVVGHERWAALNSEVALICNDRMKVVAVSPLACQTFGTVAIGVAVAEVVPGWHLGRIEPGEIARGFNDTVGMRWTLSGIGHDAAGGPIHLLRFRPPAAEKLQQQYQTNFLQALRHDVRSPLTALRGLVAVLIDEPLMASEERGPLLELLRVEAERIVNFVEDYLVAMRLRIDARPQQKRLCELRSVLAQYFSELEPHASVRRIHFEQQLEDCWVEADVALLEAFVRNFIGAVFRMADAGSTVRVELSAESLVIRGRGPGLFHQLLERPWTSLARSTSSGKRTPGAALGLFLVKKIADAHGWSLDLGVTDGVFSAKVIWSH